MSLFTSWGGYPAVDQKGIYLANRRAFMPDTGEVMLPYGLGRSYGDSCLNASGKVLSSKLLQNFIDFDRESGLLRCEAGVTLAEIIEVCLPHGWFLPVTPGTKFVTLGGAVANDVHGKNHHHAGSFGNHVTRFELLRSDGKRITCSLHENAEWFRATIGGLGLTGFIVWVELQLKRVKSLHIETQTIKYRNLDDFFALSRESELESEYTVAWLDCLANGKDLGRGHFIRGNHSSSEDINPGQPIASKSRLSVPVQLPVSLVNSLTVRAFNKLYYHRQQHKHHIQRVMYDPFFYPLDGILHWNRIYGHNGFFQHQCVIPEENASEGIREILRLISLSGLGSFLVVLKMMGDIKSRGLLSFPQKGATLAIDFPFSGEKTLKLLSQLDEIVSGASGRIYPAKDARMSADFFRASYPEWQMMESMRDPGINSDFWRRVTGE